MALAWGRGIALKARSLRRRMGLWSAVRRPEGKGVWRTCLQPSWGAVAIVGRQDGVASPFAAAFSFGKRFVLLGKPENRFPRHLWHHPMANHCSEELRMAPP
jgi:hypothetical protein